MNSDQLRELAERLQPMAAAPGFDGLDIPTFVAWLRQCAEREPVGHARHEDGGLVLNFDWPISVPPSADFALYAAPAPQPMSDERRAIEDAAYERAAQECDMAASDYRRSAPGSGGGYDWKADCAEECASAIRALKGDAK